MKTLAIIIAAIGLTSCGIPVSFTGSYTDPETGLSVGGGYPSKVGIVIDLSK